MVTAKNKRAGTGVCEIARAWGTSAPYVTKFLRRVGLQPLENGRYDLAEATRLRAQYTVVGGCWQRRHENEPMGVRNSFLECQGCRESYSFIDSRQIGTPHPERYCTPACQTDRERGLGRATIRRKILREGND